MARLLPFRALRYRDDIPLDMVIAPPYDVQDEAQAAELRARDPHNIVHVDLPVPPGEKDDAARDVAGAGGSAAADPYERAAAALAGWRREGVLRRDEEPAVTLLTQLYRGPDGEQHVRRGLLARLVLVGLDQGVVLPHERTHEGPKLDRLRLYRAAHADLSPVFLLADDPGGELARAIAAAADAAEPPRIARTDDGVEQRVAVLGGGRARRLAVLAGDHRLFIADGHHRYETALAYRDERRAAGDHSADTLLVFVCSAADPGLTVRATHRLVRGVGAPSLDELAAAAAGLATVGARVEGLERCRRLAGSLGPSDRGRFVLYSGREDACIRLDLDEPQAAGRLAARGLRPPLAGLAVTRLHELVLPGVVGLTPGRGELAYAASVDEALGAVRAGQHELAVFLAPTPVADVLAVASAGQTMPQKSTYFAPKVPTGLLIDDLGG